MTSITTIHLIDQPGGGVMVCTTAGSPLLGQRLTPGQALATDLLNECTHRASEVRYWHGKDNAMELVRDLLNPDQYGWAVSPEVHRAARRVVGTDAPPPPSHHSPLSNQRSFAMSLAPIRFTDLPAMGQPLSGGTFAGITTHPDGKHYAEVLLSDQGSGLNHPQAVAWTEALGATLPTRPIAALLFSNLKAQLPPHWHWLQETEGASCAWGCYFYDGHQIYYHKSYEGSAVAVRSIPLIA